MANYTNQVPAKLNKDDQLTFNPQGSGNYILPRGEYQITVASAPGGPGQTERAYTASTGAAVEFYGGKGGAGISASFCIAFDKETAIAVAIGTIGQGVGGTGYYGYYDDEPFSHKGASGGAGGSGAFKANGTVVAQVSGGGGGSGASMYVGRPTVTGAGWSRSVTGSRGSDGAHGAVLVAPTGYTTAINNAAGIISVKVLSLNAPPSTPEPITYVLPMSNRPLELSCATSIDPDLGDTVSYVWEQRISGAGSGVWEQVAITAEPKTVVMAPVSGNSVTYRVKAVDNHSAESGYATGSAKAIVYNFPPIISGEDRNDGKIHEPFSYSFTVDDPDVDDKLTVWVYLDETKNELLKINDAVRNKNYSVNLKEIWEYVSMGPHTLIIRAIDDKGGEAFRRISFARFSNRLEVQLSEPITFEDLVLTVLPFVNATAGKDATWLIQIKNDSAASWEDATRFNYAGEIYKFVNQNKSTDPTRFQCRVTIDKSDLGGEIVFFGASFVLNANGNEANYAQGIRINPADITPKGLLNASDDNVMKALNTLSMASLSGTGGITGNWKKNVQGSYYKLGTLLICRGEKEVEDASIWGELEYSNMIVRANAKQAECGLMLISARLPIHTWMYPAGFAGEPFVTATLNDQRKTGGKVSIKYMAIGESAT